MGVNADNPLRNVVLSSANWVFQRNVGASSAVYRLTTRLDLPITPLLRETSGTYSADELKLRLLDGTAHITSTDIVKLVTGTNSEPIEFDAARERILAYTLQADFTIANTDIPNVDNVSIARETALDYAANPTNTASPDTLEALRIGVQKLFRIVQDLQAFKEESGDNREE